MILERYKILRQIFDYRYNQMVGTGNHFQGFVKISAVKQDIYNFPLFFYIYSYDRGVAVHNNTWLVDSDKRYKSYTGRCGTKFKPNLSKSLVDIFPDQFNKIVKHYYAHK